MKENLWALTRSFGQRYDRKEFSKLEIDTHKNKGVLGGSDRWSLWGQKHRASA